MVSGTYTGNGTDNRVFAGLGFRPEAVIIIQVHQPKWESYEPHRWLVMFRNRLQVQRH